MPDSLDSGAAGEERLWARRERERGERETTGHEPLELHSTQLVVGEGNGVDVGAGVLILYKNTFSLKLSGNQIYYTA